MLKKDEKIVYAPKWARMMEHLQKSSNPKVSSKFGSFSALCSRYPHLLPIDFFFAENILEKSVSWHESHLLFLAHLLAASRQGHLCFKTEDPQLLQAAESLPQEVVEEFLFQKNGFWYLQGNWNIEQQFLHHWKRLKINTPLIEIPFDELTNALLNEPLQPEQRDAILKASQLCITFICGGPGTGKTFTAATLLKHFRKWISGTIMIAAPTGKATANLRQKLPQEKYVQTLHATLKNKLLLLADLIIVDEASMIDAKTLTSFFESIKPGARVVLIGDPHQLPPVETGHFFTDLVASLKEHVAELKTCLRTELKEVIDLSRAALIGAPIPFAPLPSTSSLLKILLEKLPLGTEDSPEVLFELYSRFRALSPLRQGPYGIDRLNEQLYQHHQLMNPSGLVPILITVNDADLGLFNGDVGFLNRSKEVAFFSEKRKFPSSLLPRYEWAYLLSVHKSQGSEFEEVMVLLPDGSERFGRPLLYTAITRARKKVTVYGNPQTVKTILEKTLSRVSGIQEQLGCVDPLFEEISASR